MYVKGCKSVQLQNKMIMEAPPHHTSSKPAQQGNGRRPACQVKEGTSACFSTPSAADARNPERKQTPHTTAAAPQHVTSQQLAVATVPRLTIRRAWQTCCRPQHTHTLHGTALGPIKPPKKPFLVRSACSACSAASTSSSRCTSRTSMSCCSLFSSTSRWQQ